MSYKPDAHFFVAVGALISVVLLAINNARLVKKGTLLNQVHGLLPVVATVVFHISWWMQTEFNAVNIITYIVGCIATTAFLFGTAFMTAGCLKLENDELCINKDNKAFKLFSKLPINFDGKSICSISWLAALCIFLMPVFMSIIAVLCAVASIVICLFTWQNPIPYFLTMVKLEGWPSTKMRNFGTTSIPVSPVIWGAVLSAIGTLIYFAIVNISIVFVTIGWTLAFAAILGGLWLGLVVLSNKMVGDWEVVETVQKEKMDWEVTEAYDALKRKKNQRPLLVWGVFWQVFRQRFCPKIKYCCTDEMGNHNCDDYPY